MSEATGPMFNYTITINANPNETAEALVSSMAASIFISLRSRWMASPSTPGKFDEKAVLRAAKDEVEFYLLAIPESSPFHAALRSFMNAVLPRFAQSMAKSMAEFQEK